jgi:glycosyltransferase involved in cell wall biosynthesis
MQAIPNGVVNLPRRKVSGDGLRAFELKGQPEGAYRESDSVGISNALTNGNDITGPPPKRRVCMLAYTHYEADNRVMRYAKALVDRGNEVDVIALKDIASRLPHEVLHGVNVYRIQHRVRDERGKSSYLYRLMKFLLRSTVFLTRKQYERAYDVIHVHNVPDFLVFSAWYSKIVGAKIILDIHDILPEFFSNKFRKSESGAYVHALKWIERMSAGFADHVIISNHLWYDKITSRSVEKGRCSVMINHVDSELFGRSRTRTDNKCILLYHGGLQAHQGLDIAIRAFSKVLPQIPEVEFHIYGGGSSKLELKELIRQLGIEEKVILNESLPAEKIAPIVANADLGIIAKRADSFGNEAYSTKIMEFMAAGVPVIVSRTKIDRFYFNDSVVRFFESGDVDDLAESMVALIRNPGLREELTRNASLYVSRNNWNSKKNEYFDLIDSLLLK